LIFDFALEKKMKRVVIALAGMGAGALVQADQLTGIDKFICAAAQVQICLEADTCYLSSAWELDMPDLVVIDLKKKSVSTTKASGLNRSTPFSSINRIDGRIFLQGVENGRAFSFVVDEATGRVTVAVARDGVAVNVFGAFTATDI
jgi:hypothetical protein